MYQALYNFPVGTYVTFDDEDKSVYEITSWQYHVCKTTGIHDATVVMVSTSGTIYFANPLYRVKKVEVD